ncbi:MAG TPA: hypothetical protein VIS51_03980 [Solirubrobacterales bacterium]
MADTTRQVRLAEAQYIVGDIEVDEFERIVWAIFHLDANVHVYRYQGHEIGCLNELAAFHEWLEHVQTRVRFTQLDPPITIAHAPWRR